jgi:hemolysin activation/secretion protein
VPQLNELLKVITDYYLAKGLVTSRAYLPQQDLSSGISKCWWWKGVSKA